MALLTDGTAPPYTHKGEVHPRICHEDLQGEYRYSSTLPLTSVPDGMWVVNAPPRPPYPLVRQPGSIAQEAA